MSKNNKRSNPNIKYIKTISEIEEYKDAFHSDIEVLNKIIWRSVIEEMCKEEVDKNRENILNYYKNELEALGNDLESDLKNIERAVNLLLNFLAEKASFEDDLDRVDNLGFCVEGVNPLPIDIPIPIKAQELVFLFVDLINNIITDIMEIYREFGNVQELFDDTKGLYDLKKKVGEMSYNYYRLKDFFESGKNEIMNKNDAMLNMHTNLIFNKMNEDKAKYSHRKLSREICVTQIKKAFDKYGKSYFGTIKKIKKSDSYLRDMLSGWNTYLRTDKANGESHRPLRGYEEAVFKTEDFFYQWALDILVPHFYEIEEKRERIIREIENQKNIKNDTIYEEKKRKIRRKIYGSHEPINNAQQLLDEDNNEREIETEEDNMHYFDDPEDVHIYHLAEILAKRLDFQGTTEEFCNKYGYSRNTVDYAIDTAKDNLAKLLRYKK